VAAYLDSRQQVAAEIQRVQYTQSIIFINQISFTLMVINMFKKMRWLKNQLGIIFRSPTRRMLRGIYIMYIDAFGRRLVETCFKI
jgi:hypothetical protein